MAQFSRLEVEGPNEVYHELSVDLGTDAVPEWVKALMEGSAQTARVTMEAVASCGDTCQCLPHLVYDLKLRGLVINHTTRLLGFTLTFEPKEYAYD